MTEQGQGGIMVVLALPCSWGDWASRISELFFLVPGWLLIFPSLGKDLIFSY
jgi:hypothetical protein